MRRLLLPLSLLAAAAAALLIGPAGADPAAAALRAPRVAAALVSGGGLAVAGVAMQALLRNALADPFILGMSSGASLGAVSTLLLGAALPVAAAGALGALAAALLVAGISRTPEGAYPPTRLLLSGVAVSAVLGAITLFLLQLAPQSQLLRAALFWTSGSLSPATGPGVAAAGAATLGAAALLRARARDLDCLLLGEETAASLGVRVRRLRLTLLLLASGLTGVLVALAGPIAFVGLAAPHLARLTGGATHAGLLPRSAAAGALLLLLADTGARAAFAPRELPTGILTAALGGPFFLWLLRRGRYTFGEAL